MNPGVLRGVKVVELPAIGPVPYAATLLADLGAEVIRIDRLSASGLGVPVPPEFDVHGRSRRSVALDLKQAAGVELALSLIDQADVLLEGFRPGVAERLGLGPEVCRQRNPRLVFGRMTGYGQDGPWAHRAGHDLNYIALSGALNAIGPSAGDGGPVPPLNLVGDYGGGSLFLVMGVLAALLERHSSGEGQVVDTAMTEGAASLMGFYNGLTAAGQWQPERCSNLLDGGAPFYATYRCADGRDLALGALEPKFFAEVLRRLALPDSWNAAHEDRAQWPALRQVLAQTFSQRSREAWLAVLGEADTCVAPVLSLEEAPQHEQARARGTYVQVGELWQPAPVPRFDRTPSATPRPAPQPGAHTWSVLQSLGHRPEDLAALAQAGVIPPEPATP